MTYTTQSVKVTKTGIIVAYKDAQGVASEQNLNFDNKTFTCDNGFTVSAGNSNMAGDLAVAGGVNMGGIAHVEGAATMSSTLGVSGATSLGSTLAVTGNTNLGSALSVSGALTQSGAATFGSTVGVSGATSLGSTLAVTGTANLGSALNVSGASHLSSSLLVDGTSHLVGQLTQDGAASFGSTVGISGATTLGSTLAVSGASTLGSTLTVSGATTINNDHTVNGTSAVNGAMTVSGATAVGGALNVTGAANLGSTMDVAGASYFASTVEVSGTSALIGAVTMSDALSVGTSLDVTGASHLSSTLLVDGTTHLVGDLTQDGAASFGSTLDVTGASHLVGDVQVDGAVSMGSTLDVTGATHLLNTLLVDGETHIVGETYMDAPVSVGNTLYVGSAATLDDTLHVTGATDVASTLDVTGATTLESTLDVTGATTMASTLSVTSDVTLSSALDVSGAVTMASTLNVTDVATFQNSVTINGNLTVIGSQTSVNTTNLDISDNAILISDGNTTDTVESGIMLQYKPSGSSNVKYAGVKRLPTTGEFVFFKDATQKIAEPTVVPDAPELVYSPAAGGYAIRVNYTNATKLTSLQVIAPNGGSGMTTYTHYYVYGATETNGTNTILVHEQNGYTNSLVSVSSNFTTLFKTFYIVFDKVTPGNPNFYMNLGHIVFNDNSTVRMPNTVDLLGNWGSVNLGSGGQGSPINMFTTNGYYYFAFGSGVYDNDGNYIGSYAHGLQAAVSASPVEVVPTTALLGEWVTFDFGSSVEVASYSVGPYSGSITLHKWAMAGSNDGTKFTLLDQRDTPNTAAYSVINYPFSTPLTAYRYIRFIIQNYQSNDGWYFRFGMNMRRPDGSFLTPVATSASSLWNNAHPYGGPQLGLNTTDNVGAVGPALQGAYERVAEGTSLYSGTNYAYVGTAQTDILVQSSGSSGSSGSSSEPVGDIYAVVVADSFNSASDQRLKKDIAPLDSALEKMDQIRGVTYHWIDPNQSQELQVGVIAQEIQSVFPQLVHQGANGYLSVDYPKLTAVLIQSVKELKAMVLELAAAKQQ